MIYFTLFIVVIAALGAIHVREEYKRDVAPPDLHTDVEHNPWLKAKDLALHSQMRKHA